MNPSKKQSRAVRIILFSVGSLSLALGIAGAILPVLPAVPFFVLSGYCYSRSSERMHGWLFNNEIFGKQLRKWRDDPRIPLHIKISTIVAISISLGVSFFYFNAPLALKLVTGAIGLASMIVVLSMPTRR